MYFLKNLQSLCCVDKKGILSYPNPSPEKVFFLQNPTEESQTDPTMSDIPAENKEHHHKEKKETSHKKTEPGTILLQRTLVIMTIFVP